MTMQPGQYAGNDMTGQACPVCNSSMFKNAATGQMFCPSCKRTEKKKD